MIGHSTLFGGGVVARKVAGGAEDVETSAIVRVVAFLLGNRTYDITAFEPFGCSEFQLAEINPYFIAVFDRPPLHVECFGNRVDRIPAIIGIERDEFHLLCQIVRYGSHFPVCRAQKGVHVVGDEITEGCEVGRVAERRFVIGSFQPEDLAALHVVLPCFEFRRVFISACRGVVFGTGFLGYDLEFSSAI